MKQIKDLNVGVWFQTLPGNLYQLVERPEDEEGLYKIKTQNGESRYVHGEVRVSSKVPSSGLQVLIEHLELDAWFAWKGYIYKLIDDGRDEETGEGIQFVARTASGVTAWLSPGAKVTVFKAPSHEFPCNCGAIFTVRDAYLAHAATFNCKSGSPDGVLSEGVKHDGEKPMMGLLPFGPLREVAKVLTFGAKKYAPGNWKKVTPPSRYFDAALRHLADYAEGEDDDQESGLSHLAHATCCLLFALWHQGKGRSARHSEED